MDKGLFEFRDYLAYLKQKISRPENPRGYQRRCAEAAGCAPSYLSAVLSGKSHLLPEQGYRLTNFWAMNETESEFFISLVHLARSSSREYRIHLLGKLQTLENRSKKLKHRSKGDQIRREANSVYYSSWLYSAIHVLASIDNFQSIEKISKALKISPEVIGEAVTQLVQMGIVEKTELLVRSINSHLHIGADQHMSAVFHASWRNRLSQRPIVGKTLESYSGFRYCGAFSVSKQDIHKLSDDLRELFDRFQKLVENSNEETLAVLSIDLADVLE